MPGYPWLSKTMLVGEDLPPKMKALRLVGVPYSDAEIAKAPQEVAGKTEEDALIAYLQELGTVIKSRR
jgi:cytochrome c oxidase cbb3-type subunit 2